MRVPTIENYSQDNIIETLSLNKIEKANRHISILTDKDKIRFIKQCEIVIRTSPEYRDYVDYLKEYIDMTQCSFFNKINNKERSSKVRIEIHHEPFTLYDLTSIVTEKAISQGDDLNYFKIAEEVMKLHYLGVVGLIPLSITVHKLVHMGKLFIPMQAVYGNFMEFLETYEEYISDEMTSILLEKFRISKDIAMNGKQDLSILNKKFIYVDIDGMSFPEIVEPKE